MMHKIPAMIVAGLLGLSASALTPASAAVGPVLEELAQGAHRTPENKARNLYRHPFETLTFFGLKPDMTVVEIYPAAGWYTEIIAPYVNEKGQYYAAVPVTGAKDEVNPRLQLFKEKLAAAPDLYGNARIIEMTLPQKPDIAPAGSADMVLTFRNFHGWMRQDTTEAMLKSVYKALKPGGVFAVVDHRGDETRPQDPKALSGYVNQSYAIRVIEKAGFKLIDASEINANTRDTRDHPKGVWTLPPSLILKDQDREKYMAIGESDRFTLKFIKPKKQK